MDNEYELRYLPLFYEDMYEKVTYIREKLMVQLMPGKYKDIDIMINYSKGIVMKLGDLTPEWWID